MNKILLTALASLTLATACKKDDTTTPAATTMQVSGTLAGANEVPAITTVPAATGSFTGTYTPSTQTLNYTLTFSNLSGNATAAHLHYGDSKHSGNVWLPINIPAATSGSVSGTAILTTTAATSTSKAASQPDSLTTGHVYANIHTANNPGGEVRANVVVK